MDLHFRTEACVVMCARLPSSPLSLKGWDGIFLEDYIIWQGHQDTPTFDPWIALAAMALSTKRIRLGTGVTPLTRRRPWKVARETVTLDYLSNGRLILGVGLGDVTWDHVTFSQLGEVTDSIQRAKMLDEALDVLAGLWSAQSFSYDEEYYHVKQVAFLPPPVQKPRIPIWVGGGYPLKGPLQRAARWDGACLYKHTPDGSRRDMTPDDVQALKAFIESHRTTSTPFDIAIGGRARRDAEQDRVLIRSLAEAGATWYVEYVPSAELDTMREAIKRGPLRIE